MLGSRTIMWSLVSAAMGQDGWCVVVGLSDVGWYAAQQAGVSLERVLYLPEGATPPILAAAIDGADVAVLGPGHRLTPAEVRAMSARLRNRGSLLVTSAPWPGAIQLDARITHATGCSNGAGYVSEWILEARRGPTRVRLAAGETVRTYEPLAVVS